MNFCHSLTESPIWKKSHGGVKFDGFCSYCGVELKNKKLEPDMSIQGDGIKLQRFNNKLTIDGFTYFSREEFYVCSKCQ